MKRLLRSLLLGAILSALLCVGALAADTNDPGIFDISIKNNSTTITPRTVDGDTITADNGYYANAVKFEVKAEKLAENQQYLLLVLKGGADGSAPGVPTAENIAYIDQMAATETGVSFTAYPKELTKGTYYVYLVGGGTAFNAAKPDATFQCDQKYILGDADSSGTVDVNDAVKILKCIVGNDTFTDLQRLAADADKNGDVDVNDAVKILKVIVGNDHF